MNDADRLETLLDRAALVDVMSAYATGLDARDWVLWRSVFLDDLVYSIAGDRVKVARMPKMADIAELSLTEPAK